MPTRQVSFRSPREQWEAFKAKAAENGSTASALLNQWISAYLAGEMPSQAAVSTECIDTETRDRLADLTERIDSIDSRVTGRINNLANRLDALESRPTAAPLTAPTVGTYAAPSVVRSDFNQTTESAPGGTVGHRIKADGHRWLTTGQAYDRAVTRGYQGSAIAFRGWSQRNAEICQADYGLRYTPHGSKSNALASFEDLRSRPKLAQSAKALS